MSDDFGAAPEIPQEVQETPIEAVSEAQGESGQAPVAEFGKF